MGLTPATMEAHDHNPRLDQHGLTKLCLQYVGDVELGPTRLVSFKIAELIASKFVVKRG